MSSREHITTDAEWQEHFESYGRKAAKEEKRVSFRKGKNPYGEGSRAHAAWQKGYDEEMSRG